MIVKSLLIIFTVFTTLVTLLFVLNSIDMIVRPNYKNLNDSEFVIVAIFVSALIFSDIILLKKFWKRDNQARWLRRSSATNIGFKLCPGDVNLVLFFFLITLVLGDRWPPFNRAQPKPLTDGTKSAALLSFHRASATLDDEARPLRGLRTSPAWQNSKICKLRSHFGTSPSGSPLPVILWPPT